MKEARWGKQTREVLAESKARRDALGLVRPPGRCGVTTTAHEPSHSRYSRGCRCEGCREAHRAYTVSRRKVALAAGTLSHGVGSTYAAGCRCWKCKEARRVIYFTAASEYQPKGRRRQRRDGAA